jgi:hypothetical protein
MSRSVYLLALGLVAKRDISRAHIPTDTSESGRDGYTRLVLSQAEKMRRLADLVKLGTRASNMQIVEICRSGGWARN